VPAPDFCVREPYVPRAIARGPLLTDAGWRLKSYGIAWDGHPRRPGEEPTCKQLLWDALPVWDLEVIAHERDSYVRHVLRLGPSGIEDDLQDVGGTA
jgi:hypothetical protein